MKVVTKQFTPEQYGAAEVYGPVQPAQWEIYAMLPALIIIMVMMMVMNLVTSLTKPEVMKELAPAAVKAAILKKA